MGESVKDRKARVWAEVADALPEVAARLADTEPMTRQELYELLERVESLPAALERRWRELHMPLIRRRSGRWRTVRSP